MIHGKYTYFDIHILYFSYGEMSAGENLTV